MRAGSTLSSINADTHNNSSSHHNHNHNSSSKHNQRSSRKSSAAAQEQSDDFDYEDEDNDAELYDVSDEEPAVRNTYCVRVCSAMRFCAVYAVLSRQKTEHA